MLGFSWKIREIILPVIGLEELAVWLPSVSVAWIWELSTVTPLSKQVGENRSIGLDLALDTPVSC